MVNKGIAFLTGTRAEYGKMKNLMRAIEDNDNTDLYIFVTGMHMLEKYGMTKYEVLKDNYKNVYCVDNSDKRMDLTFSKTVRLFSEYVEKVNPDAIVVHGDRLEALAGAIVGASNNIKVFHIEGGEVSGTIDESIRHAITKFSHIHLVANEESKNRVIQLGENKENIYIVGSPDIDVMLSGNLPTLDESKKKYEFDFEEYAIFMYHPVVTEVTKLKKNIDEVVTALEETGENYIVVYPNNDEGTDIIFDRLNKLSDNPRFRMYPSISFEYFLTMLKNAKFMIGNSSAGIRETGIFSVPGIDIGNRQINRYSLTDLKNLQHVMENKTDIIDAISKIDNYKTSVSHFGVGDSTEEFMKLINDKDFWEIELQKNFVDMSH